MSLKVILADDHDIVRTGFRTLLEQQGDIQVVGEADNGRTALELTRKLSPDLVLMDVAMPHLNGVDGTWQIVRDCPGVKVLALSMHPSSQVVMQMLQAGASGYLVKTCALEELVDAVRTVAAGKVYLSPDITGGIVDRLLDQGPADVAPTISHRGREVLQLVAEGKTTKEIASMLHVSVKTIEAHRQHIMDKLGIRTIAELTKYAVREGLTPLEI